MAEIKYPEMFALVQQATNTEEDRIVPTYADLVLLGFKHNLLYKSKFKSKEVGVHRKNRNGAMVSGREAMGIWDEIDRIGVAPELFVDATCFEEPASRINEIAFLKRVAADQHLRQYVPGDIRVSSVACSHWNQASSTWGC